MASNSAHAQAFVRSVTGDAWIVAGTAKRICRVSDMVRPGERVQTGATATVELMLADASRATVQPSSRVTVDRSRSATTALSVQSGSVRFATSPYRWRGEVFQVSSPVVTTGVRGTIFTVSVAATGEARVDVDSGVVISGALEVPAGTAAVIGLDGLPTSARSSDAERVSWSTDRAQALVRDRARAAEGLGGLLRDVLQRRGRYFGNFLQTLRAVGDALKNREPGETLPGIEAVARAVNAFKGGVDRAREVLTAGRESDLRVDVLRELIDRPDLPPLPAFTARVALNLAERDRVQRERERARLDQGLAQLDGALVFLAAAAAAEPNQGRTAARIIGDGLGLPVDAEPLATTDIEIRRSDLGWEPGQRWTVLRTLRGRTDVRVPVTVSVDAAGNGLRFTRTPLAFDTPVVVRVVPSDTEVWMDAWEGQPLVSRAHPALLYRFPIRVGDTWTVWALTGFFANSWRVDRTVVAAERIRTASGVFDCLRVETRLRHPRQNRAPLIQMEWLSPGAGVVREISFRNEIQSMMWDERVAGLE